MMGLTWYILGLLTTGSLIFLWKLSWRYALNWKALAGFGCGIILVLFSIAWSVGAVLEGVPRAGSMGIILFGLPGLVLFTVAFRYSTHRLERKQVSDAKPDELFEQDETPITLKTVAPTVSDKSVLWSIVHYGAFISLVIALLLGA
jgi:hypothetical protein